MQSSGRRSVPTPEELRAWRSHVETFEIVRARIESRLQQESHLSRGDYLVLLALSEAEGGTLRSSTLASHIHWERSRLSGQLGRMEKRGLLHREPCPEDARGTNVVLTKAGVQAFRDSTVPHLRAIKDVFVDGLTPAQLEQLTGAAASMRAHLDLDPDT